MNRMRHILYLHSIALVLTSLFLTGCGGDSVSGVEGAIIDDSDNEHKLHRLLTVINLKSSEGKNVILERIDSISLSVNGSPWGVFTSSNMETSRFSTTTEGNLNVSEQKAGYLVLAEYEVPANDLNTAGQIAQYLRDRLSLPPGDHICEVTTVTFTDNAGSPVTVYPNIYIPFTVSQNIASIYLGEITVTVD